MYRPNVADTGAVPGDHPQNAGKNAHLLHILDSQCAEELGFLRIARHSLRRPLSANSKRWALPAWDNHHSNNVTLSVKADNLHVGDRSEALTAGRHRGGPMKFARVAALALLPVLITAVLAACGDGDDKNKSATATGSAAASEAADEEVKLTLVAQNTKFDKTTLEAPAGEDVALTMENKDSIEHTFSMYPSADSKDPLFAGQRFAGPSFLTYGFTAPETPGTYHFQCDIHPNA